MAALWLVVIVGFLVLGRGRDARDAARFIPDCLVLLKRLLRDERVPRRAKIAVAWLIPYLALPIDLIPDFIPVVGQLDDALLVLVTLRYVARTAGRDVIGELWPGSERALRVVMALA